MNNRHTATTAMLAAIGATAIVVPAPSQSARAQGIPAVDVCTGVSLERSAVTEVIGAVNQPLLTDVEGAINGIVGGLNPIAILGLSLPTLNVDLTSALAAAAAGDPISLRVLDSDGTVVGASEDCNVTANAFTLDDEAGLAIGGNVITGLGENGLTASAAELDAIAFGNNASAGIGATAAVAIGTDASATAANSVALGAGSVADRAPQIAYSAAGITGTVNSAGAVSVGASGQERQIINVAPGSADTDAATVGQVTGAVAAATQNVIFYDASSQTSVTLGGAGGTTITNVAAGAVSGASSDAVNGSQLFATNQNVSANTTNITNLDGRVTVNEGNITSNTTNIVGNTANISNNTANIASNTTNIAANTTNISGNTTNIATNTTAIANIDNRVSTNETNIADNTTLINNLISGSTGSTDLTVVNARIDQNESDITNLDARITVNEGDLLALDTRVTASEGSISSNTTNIANLDARVTTNEGDISDLDGRVTINETNIASLDSRVTTNEGDISNLDGRTTVNEGEIAVLEQRVDNIPVGYVDDSDGSTPSATPTNTAAFASAGGGAVRVTNVAAGTLNATSTDVVNGSQLFATNQQVTQNRADIDANTVNIVTNTANIDNITNNLSGSTVSPVQYSNPGTPTVSNGGTITNNVTLVGANVGAPVALHNVADAVSETDAVNLRTLTRGLSDVMVDARAYTDLRFADLSFDLNELENDAFAGTAAALALATVPQTLSAGANMIGGAISHYRGQTAFGFGFSSAIDDGSAVLRLNGSIDTNGHAGVAAGAGLSF